MMFRKHLLLSLWLLSAVGTSWAQSNVVNDGATVIIESGVRIDIEGDLINQTNVNDGLFDNSGTINVSGDWTNNAGNAALVADQGTVSLDSDQPQTIGGTSTTVFNNLDLSGTGQKSLGVDTTVGSTGVLDLGDSDLLLESNTLNIDNSVPAAILSATGGIVSESTAADSVVSWLVGATTGTFSVPFETGGGTEIPVQASIANAGTGPGRVDFSTYPTPIGNTPLPPGAADLDVLDAVAADAEVVVNRFWLVANAGFTTAPQQTVTVTYDPVSDLVFDGGNNDLDGNLAGVFFSGAAGDWVDGNGVSDPANNQASVVVPGGNSYPIAITGINDQPTLTLASATVAVPPGQQGVQTFNGFVDSFDLGALDDIEQAPSYVVVTDIPGLFDVEPAIAADGTLTFTPGPSANGTVEATVTLVDGGGVEFGGIDSSVGQVFTIILSPIGVPTLSQTGLLVFMLALLMAGAVQLRRRQLSR